MMANSYNKCMCGFVPQIIAALPEGAFHRSMAEALIRGNGKNTVEGGWKVENKAGNGEDKILHN